MYSKLKKLADISAAIVLLLVLWPFCLIIAAAIRMDSKGPVFFKQKRMGRGGRPFTIFKFRTMRVEAVRDGRKLADVERMTKLGNFLRKTSLDEIPQLVNIVRGEMSFIGPRPLPLEYAGSYSAEQMRRHEVTPGLSGWAQVNGRNQIGWAEKFDYDLYYVDHLSFLLDLKILWLTLCTVAAAQDVNHSAMLTMPALTEEIQLANKGDHHA
ncbi:sugar transferase [Paenibacillus pinistramenti]|uniref:sugar transferase n=1 Tax=Paenibacillus pinistramenti TaxID=1768003 RepID=UPI001109E74F|nr:sugar transferase [Paenibacillus pinistramenti]